MIPRSLEQLRIWEDAIQLSVEAYDLSATWSDAERYGLVSQVRRASVSVAANIAEGQGRASGAERSRFGSIARGSAYELVALLEVAIRNGVATEDAGRRLQRRATQLVVRLHRYIEAAGARRPAAALVPPVHPAP
ncbi:MAG: four helix bundle protein [Methanobacteriota archaeon]